MPVNILAFDTAAAACSAVLTRDGAQAAHAFRPMARGQAEALVPMIEGVMQGTEYGELTAIGVTVGPGAFTGLRIALATARGLALATGVPAHGISNFAVAAYQAVSRRPVGADVLIVALETKRADFYLQAFTPDGEVMTLPASVSAEDLAGWLPAGRRRVAVAGDAAARLIAALPAGIAADPVAGTELPDAAIVAALVAARVAAGIPAVPLRPLYLRPPDATLPKPFVR